MIDFMCGAGNKCVRATFSTVIRAAPGDPQLGRGARVSVTVGESPVLLEEGISGIPYFGLARGFLTGKYRPGTTVQSIRAEGVADYQNERGYKVVAKLEEIAKEHGTSISSVALGWLGAQPGVATPIASARTVEQLQEIVNFTTLTNDEIAELSDLTK